MLSKKEIKYIQSLGHKKFRDELKLFVAEGPKTVGELMNLIPDQIEKIYATDKWKSNVVQPSLHIVEVSEKELEKISQLKTPNQLLAVIKQFESKVTNDFSFALYLDTIQDPGNFGTIIRIADWFNIKNIICSLGCADVYTSKVVQSTMGSIARVNIFYEEGNWLQKQDCTVFAATLDGEPLHTYEKVDQGILIIGNESNGISEEVIQYATKKITIPKKGNAESLNAAVATGIILSHLLK